MFPTRSDGDLLELVRKDDPDAVRELLARHAPSVFRFAMKMCRNRSDAEDVAQETLLAAVHGAKDVRQAGSFTTWLYAVARSFCIKMHRGVKRTSPNHFVETPTPRESVEGLPDVRAEAREIGAALDRAIHGLEAKYREVLVLRDVEGLSAAEVADVLGLSVEAVKTRLHRARLEVRASLASLAPGPGTSTGQTALPCRDIGTIFSRYLEGEIAPTACEAMQKHVDACTSCSAVCEGLRRSVSLCRRAGTESLSDEMQGQVRRALEAALQAGGRASLQARPKT